MQCQVSETNEKVQYVKLIVNKMVLMVRGTITANTLHPSIRPTKIHPIPEQPVELSLNTTNGVHYLVNIIPQRSRHLVLYVGSSTNIFKGNN